MNSISPKSEVLNIVFGTLSIFGIISGFLIEEFRLVLWVISFPLLILVVIMYYVADNRKKIMFILDKFRKIEETLNIYNRLNKLELAMKMRKKGDIDLLDIIKIGLAILLIYIFIKAILSVAGS